MFVAIQLLPCHSKRHTRSVCGYSIVTLRHAVPDGLATVDSALIKKFFSHVLEMEKAYRGEEVDTSTSKTVAA